MNSELRIYMCTWNVGEVQPPSDLTRLLRLDRPNLPDLYAIGIQELAHGVNDLVRDALFDDPWTTQLTTILAEKNYVRIHSLRLIGIHLAVFVRRPIIHLVTGAETAFTRTGFGGYWGNKGAVTIRLDIQGVSVCIVNCHLTAHLPNVKQRIQDYDLILETQNFKHPDTKTILDHDYVLWFGDLNFRLDDVSHEAVLQSIKNGNLAYLQEFDQLKKLMKDEMILVNFQEGPIIFDPTYKFDYGTDTYDTSSKKRKPGWCDRVLWRVHDTSIDNEPLSVRQLHYTSHPEYKDSDHKAVSSSFIIKLSTKPRPPLVTFEDVKPWSDNTDCSFSYFVASELPVDNWDWIGLYKGDFKHFHDYVTWVWAPVKEAVYQPGKGSKFSIRINKDYLFGQSGDYQLCYYSETRKAIMGMSNPFTVTAACLADES